MRTHWLSRNLRSFSGQEGRTQGMSPKPSWRQLIWASRAKRERWTISKSTQSVTWEMLRLKKRRISNSLTRTGQWPGQPAIISGITARFNLEKNRLAVINIWKRHMRVRKDWRRPGHWAGWMRFWRKRRSRNKRKRARNRSKARRNSLWERKKLAIAILWIISLGTIGRLCIERGQMGGKLIGCALRWKWRPNSRMLWLMSLNTRLKIETRRLSTSAMKRVLWTREKWWFRVKRNS